MLWRGLSETTLRLERNRGGQVGLQDFLDSWKHFALIALRISFLRPEDDGDHLFILGSRGRRAGPP
jgi:hypothetical protein